MSRNTKTGSVLEACVLPALALGGYEVLKQQNVGTRPNGGKHMADIVAKSQDESIIISMKWQQVSGTAEQKVPYEIICLREIISNPDNNYQKAYIVLGGDGWTLKDYYTSGSLSKHLNLENIFIVTESRFMGLANMSKL